MMVRLRLLVWIVCTLTPVAATADDASQPWAVGVSDDQKTRARELLDQGNALFVDNKFVEALEAYGNATAIWDHPAIRFNMVRSLIQLGRSLEASDNLEKALQYGAAPLEETVYKEALNYQKLLAKQIGTIEVTCEQAGVTLTLDGKPFATCPTTKAQRLEPGGHQIVGKKPGLLTSTTEVTMFGGRTERVKVTLDPPAKNAKVVHRWPGYVPWIAFGIGAAVVGGGVLFQVAASQQMETFDTQLDAECARTAGCLESELEPETVAIKRGAERKSAIGVSMMAAGGAGILAGAVLMYLNRGRSIYPESITPLPGGGAAVTWGGKF
jgi:hypothetical protein